MGIREFLTARFGEDEMWAREASRDERSDFPTGAHWNWVETEHDEVLVPDPSASEMLQDAHGWVTRQSLRSVERFPTSSDVGELPQFAIGTVEEVRSAVAGHIIRHDPARVLTEIAAKRRMLKRHSRCGSGMGYCDDGGHGIAPDEGTGGCNDLLDLATPYADHPDFDPAWVIETS